MSAPNDIGNVVLNVLRTHGAQQRTEILRNLPQLGNIVAVANALNRLKAKGLVERANNECWRVTDLGRVQDADERAVRAPRTGTAPSMPRPQDKITPAHTAAQPLANVITSAMAVSTAMTALQRAAQHAQDAIDAYVWEVGDPAVLEPLMASRDAARQALTAYEQRS